MDIAGLRKMANDEWQGIPGGKRDVARSALEIIDKQAAAIKQLDKLLSDTSGILSVIKLHWEKAEKLTKQQSAELERLRQQVAELTANYHNLRAMYQELEDRAVGYETERDDLAAKLAQAQAELHELRIKLGTTSHLGDVAI